MRAVRMGVASLITVFAFFIFLLHLWATHGSEGSTGAAVQSILRDSRPSQSGRGHDAQIRNETLGFERVFVLNLPIRGDRLDAFILSSSLTGFDADIIPGVNGSLVSDNSLPATEGMNENPHYRDAQVGTWRAHLNVARKIVQERLTSALIIEDDSDWDISLKDRLVDFAHGSRHLSETSTQSKSKSKTPYGDNWDMLWLGHCAIQVRADTSPSGPPTGTARQRFLIDNDPTVPSPKKRANFDWIPDMSAFPDTTRVVFQADMGICLYGYALSYRGALKVLRAQAIRKTFAAIDVGLGEMCQSKDYPFTCIGVFPQLIESHKTAGSQLRDSNINQGLEDKIRDFAYTFNVKYSSRLNADRILKAEAPTSQWSDEDGAAALSGGTSYRVVDRDAGANINIWPPNMPPRPDGKQQQKR